MPEDKFKYAELPSVGDLEDKARSRVCKLMEGLDEVVRQRRQLADQEDDLKLELELIQNQTGRTGFRFGNLTFCSHRIAGRRTIDKILLLENGCPAAVLNASYKQGAESIRNTFRRLDDPDE